MGSKIEKLFPTIIPVTNSKLNVVWSSDPMHANIEKSKNGLKRETSKNILNEVKSFFRMHKKLELAAKLFT